MDTPSGEHRFTGDIAREYELITLAYPDFAAFQRWMIEGIQFRTPGGDREEPFHVLEIGTGDGFTTVMLVEAMSDLDPPGIITTLDNDATMIRKAQSQLQAETRSGHVRLREADALAFLQDCPDSSVDVVASAFTLHNFEAGYRREVERQIYRVLRSKGIFTNADKYAPEGQERFDALAYQVDRFFEAFVTRGKLDLLRKWVIHNISDQSPRYVMYAEESISRLEALGFRQVVVSGRSHMQAVLRAVKG